MITLICFCVSWTHQKLMFFNGKSTNSPDPLFTFTSHFLKHSGPPASLYTPSKFTAVKGTNKQEIRLIYKVPYASQRVGDSLWP